MRTILNHSIKDTINNLEHIISIYHPKSGKVLTEARKLIQLDFKTFLDNEISKLLGNNS